MTGSQSRVSQPIRIAFSLGLLLMILAFLGARRAGGKGLVPSAQGLVAPSAPGINVWTSTGPGSEGTTNIYSLAIDPRDPNTIYAGSYISGESARGATGVFKSTSAGANWNSPTLSDKLVFGLAIDPSDTNTIYAGTVDRGVFRTTVFKSTDGGSSWNPANNGLPDAAVVALAVDPSNTQIIYAGTYDGKAFKSTDGGASWKSTGLTDAVEVDVLTVDPSNTNTIYGATAKGLFKSTDGGKSWGILNLGCTLDGSPCATVAIAIDPSNANRLYASAYDKGLFRSTDGGRSWNASGTGLSGLVRALAIDPSKTNTIYAGTSKGVFKCTDGGASWSEFSVGLTYLDVEALVVDPSGTYLHAGTNGGIFDFQYVTPCSDSISSAPQSFDSSGGTSSVIVTAEMECNWTSVSYASWISVASGSNNGNGTVNYSVAANTSTATRTGILSIAARNLTITQTGLPVRIAAASVAGKKLFLVGENFDPGAVILLNGDEQKTKNDAENPNTTLIAKKTGTRVKPGDKLQVRNPNGSTSPEFNFSNR